MAEGLSNRFATRRAQPQNLAGGWRGQLAEPGPSPRLKLRARAGSHLPDRIPERGRGRRPASEVLEGIWAAQHLLTVAHHAGPAQRTDRVHDFNRTGTAIGRVAALDHEIGSGMAQIGQHGFQGGSIAVYVGGMATYIEKPVAFMVTYPFEK